jgi:hypothetical protein
MHISWAVVLAGIASLVGIPLMVILFNKRPRLAKGVVCAGLLILIILNSVYLFTGEPIVVIG